MAEEKKEEVKTDDYFNITEDGGIKKKITKEAKGMTPEIGFRVKIIYIGKNSDNKIFVHNISRDKPFSFIIGANQVLKGLEICVRTMKIGEKAEFIISPNYGYGNQKVFYDLVRENETLYFEIELISFGFSNEEISKLAYERKLELGKNIKSEGVENFKAKDFENAKKKFIRATQFLQKIDKDNKEEVEGLNLYLTILSNICNCCRQQNKFNEIIEYATKGLKIKELPKLYYFRSIANAYNNNFIEAKKDLEALKNLMGNDKAEDEGVKYVNDLIESREKESNITRKKMTKAIKNLYEEKPEPRIPHDPPTEQNKENPVVFLDIKIGENEPKRVEIELFKDKVPKICENFRCLCTGEKGGNLHYKGSIFHRVNKGFMIEGGDIENKDGAGGISIYGKTFKEDNDSYDHSRKGLVSMIGSKEGDYNSQFLITLIDSPWLNEGYKVFGQVIKGIETVQEIGDLERDEHQKPKTPAVISNCGELKEGKEITCDNPK